MEKAERPLRFTVEKWLTMVHPMSARIRRGRPTGSNHQRPVCIDASMSTGAFSIYLFRQGDGTWCVQPPAEGRPVMRIA